ncbi:MAG: xanthine dehydrogenase accessory protein XdhC [Geminicoccaceae bacterium]
MIDWLTALAELGRCQQQMVLVTVAEARGSTPRAAGTKMVVMRDRCFGTIGGGHLEYKAIDIARKLLIEADGRGLRLERFPLGPSLGQCCGGMATLLFEPISLPLPGWIDMLQRQRSDHGKAVLVTGTEAPRPCKMIVTDRGSCGSLDDPMLEGRVRRVAQGLLAADGPTELRIVKASSGSPVRLLFEPIRTGDFHIVLFGAGHVGKALVQVMQGLPCSITWVDPREHEFPDIVPANVRIDASDQPPLAIDVVPPGSYVLIMTHSHVLDQAICERALRRDGLAYCGLIGSATKLVKFRRRLSGLGLNASELDGLTCPIGIDGISGKHPSEIAIAVAAQLLQRRENRAMASRSRAGRRSRPRPILVDDMSFS